MTLTMSKADGIVFKINDDKSSGYNKRGPVEPREFATYGYQLDNSQNTLTGVAIGSLFLAVACAAGLSRWFLLLLLVPTGIFVYIRRSGISRPLLIGSRYLILGDRILYYRNVDRAVLDQSRQTLSISSDKGRSIVICAEKFPTNARKADKIRINKGAKFEKVADKILTRLRETSPDCVIS